MSHKGRDRREPPTQFQAARERQRLDKWLWFARVVKTRTQAAKLVTQGHVRINAQRIAAPARSVTNGDVLTIALERRVLILRVVAPGERRGPYDEARLLYEDLTPAETVAPPGGDTGYTPGGRPTKRERRALARWLDP